MIPDYIKIRLQQAFDEISECVSCTPDILGGRPVISGTRFPIAMVLAELTARTNISEIVDGYDLRDEDKDNILKFFNALSTIFDQRVRTKEKFMGAIAIMCQLEALPDE